MVKGALYTYVRPEQSTSPELLAVSKAAMRDIGLKAGEEETEDFKQMVGKLGTLNRQSKAHCPLGIYAKASLTID